MNSKSEVALLGIIEIFRRNTATGSVRQTAVFLEPGGRVKRSENSKAKANRGISLRPVDSITIYNHISVTKVQPQSLTHAEIV